MLKTIRGKVGVVEARASMESAYRDLHLFISDMKQREGRVEELRAELAALQDRLAACEKRKVEALSRFAAGTASEDEVKASRMEVQSAREELEQANEMVQAISQFERDHSNDHLGLLQAAAASRRRFCRELSEQILQKVVGDKALRRILVQAFAALVSTYDPVAGCCDDFYWREFLSDLLDEPDESELAAAKKEIRVYFESLPDESQP